MQEWQNSFEVSAWWWNCLLEGLTIFFLLRKTHQRRSYVKSKEHVWGIICYPTFITHLVQGPESRYAFFGYMFHFIWLVGDTKWNMFMFLPLFFTVLACNQNTQLPMITYSLVFKGSDRQNDISVGIIQTGTKIHYVKATLIIYAEIQRNELSNVIILQKRLYSWGSCFTQLRFLWTLIRTHAMTLYVHPQPTLASLTK